ncbi:hypothetical protein CALVIDRAFT_171305 [Calocera viscosa TUFC12733]|uniref:Uncharacterized protein n=1 Tax=Calocera viscosa (strain TUFC12733) TaxID=1330018 RepID=A0A167L8N7_CALVF|nr:hypothetical protein CALVIDRAFT_171305 [Calocera viscosa TUFC12733]
MSFALVLAPPRMPSSSHTSLLHSGRRKHMSVSPSPSRTPPATALAPTTQQQAPRPGVITLSKPLHAYAHNDRPNRRESRFKDNDKDVAASLPSTPLPQQSFDDAPGKDEKKRKGRHHRTRSAANTPAAQSATPADRSASPSTSPSVRPTLPHLPTEPPSPTQQRNKKGPHKRAKSAAPSRASQPHTPNNGASSAPEDDLFASAVKAPEPLAANAQEQSAAAAGSAPISTAQSLNDSRTTTPPPHISDNTAPFTPAGSAPVPVPSSAPAPHNHSKKVRNLRNSMITVPPGVNITPGNGTPAKGNKTGSMRIQRKKSQPFKDDASQLSRSVPTLQTMMMHPSVSSPLINVTPARDSHLPRLHHSEYRHKATLSLAFPPAPIASLPGAASLPSTPLPRQDGAGFPQHARGATYPAGGMFPISMSELEESFAYSSLNDSDSSAAEASGNDTDEQIVFFGQRVSPDLERVDRDLNIEQAKRQKQGTKVKLAGKEDHKRAENKRREKQVMHEERAQAKEAKTAKKIVYAGPQFYNSPAPDALPPPTF